MFSMNLLYCLVACLAIGSNNVKANANEEAMEEVLAILNDPKQYDNDVMPFNESGPINVKLQMYLRNVDVDDEEMTTSVEMTFRMLWTDERLAYAADAENVNLVNTELLWLPDPFFKNAIETKQMDSIHPEAYVRIFPEGDIIYSTRLRLTLRCNMDLARFPHDHQVCPIMVASYGYSMDYIKFEMDKEIDTTEDLIYNSRFEIGEFETLSCDTTTKTGSYSCVQVDLNLDRVSSTYSMEFYIPFIFLIFVAFFSEVIPAQALLPRLLLTLVPLITLATFYFAYSLSLPAVSYARASDIFAGISQLVAFALLLHTILAYYRSLLDLAEKKRQDAEGGEVSGSAFHRFVMVLDKFMLLCIVIFYVAFFVIYFSTAAP